MPEVQPSNESVLVTLDQDVTSTNAQDFRHTIFAIIQQGGKDVHRAGHAPEPDLTDPGARALLTSKTLHALSDVDLGSNTKLSSDTAAALAESDIHPSALSLKRCRIRTDAPFRPASPCSRLPRSILHRPVRRVRETPVPSPARSTTNTR